MTKLRSEVREFMLAALQPLPSKPTPPDVRTVRLRMLLVAEEVFELLEACVPFGGRDARYFLDAKETVLRAIARAEVEPCLPMVADACADIDYVVEVARLTFGINGSPIAREVHRNNMSNMLGTTLDANGKVRKPAGWTLPDIAALLRKQGWEG